MKKIIFTVLSIFLFSIVSLSQKDNTYSSARFDSIINSKMNAPFEIVGIYPTIDGEHYSFNSVSEKTLYNFGFYGCHPCQEQMPIFFRLARKYPKLNFVYVSFDKKNLIEKELSEFPKELYADLKNVKYVTIGRECLDGIVFGYPAKYIVNSSNIVIFTDILNFRFITANDREKIWDEILAQDND